MCGIVGYIGPRNAAEVVIKGLKKLEYRGYDSFGIAVSSDQISILKKGGRIQESFFNLNELNSGLVIGHTSWATHGIPNDTNAHPHSDCSNNIALVHNGIIENFLSLREDLLIRGHIFKSDTDTEVIVHLIEEFYNGDLLYAVRDVIPLLQGSFAILVIAKGEKRIIAARYKSPLVLGIGDGEVIAGSDVTPILDYTPDVIFLEDGDLVSIRAEGVVIENSHVIIERLVTCVDWSREDARKGGFDHFMQKEIFEQASVFSQAIRSVDYEALKTILSGVKEITVVGCGTSYHAGMIFRYLTEEFARIPVRVEFASEFKYSPPPLHGLLIALTQSGETADTLAAVEIAKNYECTTLAITNVLGSSITRVAKNTLFMRAGPEVSVAATKSFIAELAVLFCITDCLSEGELRTQSLDSAHKAIEDALLIDIDPAVDLLKNAGTVFFVGRGWYYPVSLEGALKLKEISYIHAESYAAGEMKHGPFALLSEETPVVAICVEGPTYSVMISNIKEVKARRAPVIAIGNKGDTDLCAVADVVVTIPDTPRVIQILTITVILQLLAYRTAVALGRDIDRPRNLAKSVTVE